MAITGIEYRYLYAENNQTKRQISSTTKNTGTEGTTAAETTTSKGFSLDRHISGKNKVPYGEMAQDGVITYNGVTFVCDYEKNRICLGDTSHMDNCISVSLSGGGSLVVNRNNLDDLSRAIGMFTPEDVNRILRALAQDAKIQKMKKEIDDMENGEESEESGKNTAEVIEDSDTKFQIGNQSYTIKEWKTFLERFDSVQNSIREALEEKIKKEQEEALKKELLSRQENTSDAESLENILAQSFKSYDSSNKEESNSTWYLTCYDENGIWCRKYIDGTFSETLWNIDFTDASQYETVSSCLAALTPDADTAFTRDFSFWKNRLQM